MDESGTAGGDVEVVDLVPIAPGSLADRELYREERSRRVRATVANAKAKRTRAAYAGAVRRFARWAEAEGLPVQVPRDGVPDLAALPDDPRTLAGIVAAYLQERAEAGAKLATVRLDLAALSRECRRLALPIPSQLEPVREYMDGLRRELTEAQDKAPPMLRAHLARLVAATPDSTVGARDRALLLLGWFTACRRSELVALRVEDFGTDPSGEPVVLVRRSKVDQAGRGLAKHLPFVDGAPHLCPQRALRAWLDASGITEGAVFRAVDRSGNVRARPLDGKEVSRIIERAARRAGLAGEGFSAHSLRAGYVTQSALDGDPVERIMRQTGHRRVETVLGYVRLASAAEGNNVGDMARRFATQTSEPPSVPAFRRQEAPCS